MIEKERDEFKVLCSIIIAGSDIRYREKKCIFCRKKTYSYYRFTCQLHAIKFAEIFREVKHFIGW